MTPTMMIDCKIKVLETATKDIEHWDRVRVYHGAKELLGRIVPLEDKMLPKGTEGYVQIRLEEKLACKTGDKIILRAYSPMETIGGGTILDANAKKHAHADENLIETFQVKEQGEPKDIVESYLLQSEGFVESKEINEKLSIADTMLAEIKQLLQGEDKIVIIGNQMIHKKRIEDLADKSVATLKSFHEENNLKKGMNREAFKSKMKITLKTKEYDRFIEYLTQTRPIQEDKALLRLTDFEIVYDPEQEIIKNEILARLIKEALTPSLVKDYIDTPQRQTVLDGLIEQELVVRVSDELIYERKVIDKFTEEVQQILAAQGEITMNDIRDRYDLSRKFCIALLEYFDRIRVTRRVGDKRIAF